MARLLIVSNRLPLTVRFDRGEVSVVPSSGGLATGMRGPHQRTGGLWIGWPGEVGRLEAAAKAAIERQFTELRMVPLYLTSSEVTRYYEGFSNAVIWPLFHYLLDAVPTESRDWEVYKRVNERFARAVAEEYRPGDRIWVHDYQLMLVPGMLRRLLPDAQIGFFLHIPFPASEVFRTLPWREEILDGILGADLVGFHTLGYLRHFASSLLRILGVEAHIDRLWYGGHAVRLGVFPMGIDTETFIQQAGQEETIAEIAALKDENKDQRLLLGVDRLDYTKGIPRRLLAVERLFEREPQLRGHVRFVQVAVPSRTKIELYAGFRRKVDELVGRINGRFGTVHWMPVHYLYRSISERQLVALYRAADVMLVTPLRDGMNLVAKEFPASRVDGDGVLILSELAGASSELAEALHVNPYDIDGVARAIKQALTMPEDERRLRMTSLRKRVLTHDVHWWASAFLDTLGQAGAASLRVERRCSSPEEIAKLVGELRQAPRLLLLLDYDGTLCPFFNEPDLAAPDADLRELLEALAARPGARVYVISGRTKESLERWFGESRIGLVAEHGFWSRLERGETWKPTGAYPTDWKKPVRAILEEFAERTPGAVVEEKGASIAWHYRLADREFAAHQANELRLHLANVLTNLPVEVLLATKVVEVRVIGLSKSVITRQLVAAAGEGASVLAMGDDRTDEEMFSALPETGYGVHVGDGQSRARFRVSDPAAARRLLRSLLDAPAPAPSPAP